MTPTRIKLTSCVVGLVAGRVYFDELITQISLKVDWIGPQRKKSV